MEMEWEKWENMVGGSWVEGAESINDSDEEVISIVVDGDEIGSNGFSCWVGVMMFVERTGSLYSENVRWD